MNEIEIRVVDLIEKHLNGELSDAERQELESWENQSESNRRIVRHLTDNSLLKHSISDSYPDERKDRVLASINSLIATDEEAVAQVRMMTIRKYMSAAAIIGLIVCIAFFTLYVNKKQTPVAQTDVPSVVNDKTPGRNGAILKLSNGQEIVLDNAANGNLVQQGSTSIVKNGSVLVYTGKKESAEVLFNTLSTPVGRQFQVVLPDGSQAWLNSESSITYPTTFTGNERNVKVTGEVYMEVAKDAKRPFKVHVVPPVSGMEETVVQVLGTHFNINAYGDEMPVKATLLEGSIKVNEGNNTTTLKPGQQAQVNANTISLNSEVDVTKETAWKNGLFNFNNEKLKSIMPQISRWYNIDVVYENKDVQNILITGEIERKANLSEVLKILTFLNINYKLEGRKLVLKR